MDSYQAVQFSEIGTPVDVAEIVEVSSPEPRSGEVRVAMSHAPVNPADLNYLEGSYGKVAELPATPGVEGVGRVEAVGAEVTKVSVGDPVILMNHIGSWAQRAMVFEAQVAKIPEGVPLEQAAMLRINPPTAWQLLRGFGDFSAGTWIGQNAANSGVGLSLIQIAAEFGFRTVNFVRSEAAAAVCRSRGAEHVFIDGPEGLAEAKAMLGGEAPRLCANAVGGDSALRLMDLLAEQGTHVTYGAMSRQSLKVPNKFLIFKRIQLHGLWITKWMEDPGNREEVEDLIQRIGGMMRDGKLAVPIEKVYPLDEVKAAILHAQQPGRSGKVILQMGNLG